MMSKKSPLRMLIQWMILIIGLMALIIVPFIFYGDAIAGHIDIFVQSTAHHSWLLFTGITTLLAVDILLPIPSSLVNTTAGMLLGFPAGFAASWLGLMLSCLAGFGIGGGFGFGFNRILITDDQRASLETLHRRFGTWLIVLARPVPVLAETSVLFAGMGRMKPSRFLIAIALSNAGIAGVYSAAGAWASGTNAFLPAFAAALLLPLAAIVIARILQHGRKFMFRHNTK